MAVTRNIHIENKLKQIHQRGYLFGIPERNCAHTRKKQNDYGYKVKHIIEEIRLLLNFACEFSWLAQLLKVLCKLTIAFSHKLA